MKQLFTQGLFVLALFITACSNNKPIVNTKDYAKYLMPSAIKLNYIDGEIDFWTKRLQENPDHFGASLKIAGLLTNRFQYSGNIYEVKKADSIYRKINKLQKLFSSSVFRNLAANAITQHQFRQSKIFLDSAAILGDNLAYTILQQADVQLELGSLYEAQRLLKRYPQQESFEVLIRYAKILDHQGRTDEAIRLMEKAYEKVKNGNNETLYTWLKSNLGDFYSHANHLEKAYHSYLDVLKVDPENYHSLKGIAWLAFSHDKNTSAAKKIIHFLKQQHPVPDYDLLLGEIAVYENNEQLGKQYNQSFLQQVNETVYGDMYNKYRFNLYADELNDISKAMKIAQTEVRNRPTGESYSLLSWAYYKKGNIKEALHIAYQHVEGKCFEPYAVYRLAVIYKANGNNKKAKQYFSQVKSSLYELGPSFAKLISNS